MEVPENKLAISPPYMALIGLEAIAVVFAKRLYLLNGGSAKTLLLPFSFIFILFKLFP